MGGEEKEKQVTVSVTLEIVLTQTRDVPTGRRFEISKGQFQKHEVPAV